METKQQYSDDVAKTTIKIIKNIRFTDREIDVIACLLGGRSYKKIATILSITPKTVEHHIYNVMAKVGCNSREGIIDFIEKSDKFSLIKAHYAKILTNTAFEQDLKKVAPISQANDATCLIFHYDTQITKTSFVYKLERYLDIAGIKTFSKTWVKSKSKSFLINKTGTKQANCIIYVISNAFVEQLKLIGYDIHEEATNLTPWAKNGPFPIIFLLLDDKTALDFNKNQTDFTYISLPEFKNNYFLFFEILKKILPNHNFDENIAKFKKQYETLQSDTTLQGWPTATKPSNTKFGNQQKKSIFNG